MDCRSNRLHDIAGEHLAAPISMDDDISKLGRLLKAGDRCTRVGEPALAIVPQRGLERAGANDRSEEHTSELQSLMRISYAVFCLKKKTIHNTKLATNSES